MLDQIGLFSFMRLAETGGTSTGLVHLRFYWTNSSVFQGPEALGGDDLVLCSSLPLWYGCLASGLFLQHVESCFVAGGTEGDVIGCAEGSVSSLFIVLFFWYCFLCLSWMGKGRAEIQQDTDWSSCSWEKVAVSLVWSQPPCCDGIAVALKGFPRVGRREMFGRIKKQMKEETSSGFILSRKEFTWLHPQWKERSISWFLLCVLLCFFFFLRFSLSLGSVCYVQEEDKSGRCWSLVCLGNLWSLNRE